MEEAGIVLAIGFSAVGLYWAIYMAQANICNRLDAILSALKGEKP